MGNVQFLALLASQPGKAFDALGEMPRFWFPLLLALACGLVTTYWFYQVVDLPWLLEEQFRANPRTAAMTDEQRTRVLQMMSPAVVKWSAVGSVLVAVLALRLLEAAYFLVAGKVTNVQRSFRHWFALTNWSGVPGLLSTIPAVIMLAMTNNGQVDQGSLNPLSLNELFFHRTMGQPGYSLLAAMSLLQPLGWWLAFVAVRRWSGRSSAYCAGFVLLPFIVIYGCWAVMAFR
jgi:TM2 domain-containing membrane protein YozV